MDELRASGVDTGGPPLFWPWRPPGICQTAGQAPRAARPCRICSQSTGGGRIIAPTVRIDKGHAIGQTKLSIRKASERVGEKEKERGKTPAQAGREPRGSATQSGCTSRAAASRGRHSLIIARVAPYRHGSHQNQARQVHPMDFLVNCGCYTLDQKRG